MQIRDAADFKVTAWSGGTTTELYILPEESSLAARDFDLRISTAVVETEQSDFTQFSGYDRIICVLEGELKMIHSVNEGTKEVLLSTLHQSSFSGDWKTQGFGKVRDFNVIFRRGIKAELEILKARTVKLSGESRKIVFPLSEGLIINGIEIDHGKLAVLDRQHAYSVDISGDCIALMVVIHG